MSATLLADVNNQVQKFWSPVFMPDLMESDPLIALASKQYSGELKKGGDTVYVSQIARPSAQIRTVGVDSEFYDASLLTTDRVALQVTKRISAAFQLSDEVSMLSIIDGGGQEIRNALMESCMIKLNSYLYSLVAPSTSAPDHTLTSVTDFNAAELLIVRGLASAAKWKRDGGWKLLLSPSYYNDVLSATTMTSSDYVPDAPNVGGQIARQRFGFDIYEDNSAGLLTIGTSGTDAAIAFHPDFLMLALPQAPNFKVSDLHANGQFGFNISCDFFVAAAQGVDGNVKVISIINT